MQPLRSLVRRHRHLAAALVVLALAMKLLVPTGFMPSVSAGSIVIQLCSGTTGQTMLVTLPGSAHPGDEDPAAKADMPCAFAGPSNPALSATDPILLALAIAFVIAAIFRAVRLVLPAARPFLRPPPIGPPAIA